MHGSLACWLLGLMVSWLDGFLAWWFLGWLDGWLLGWLAGWLLLNDWGYLAGCLAPCFERALFRCGVCCQLMILLALPYIYSVDQPIRSQYFRCPGWPMRSQDCQWKNSGFWLVSLYLKVWATLGQCPSLCSTLKERTSISNNLEWIWAICWQFQEAAWVGKAGNSNLKYINWIYQSLLVVIFWIFVLYKKW